MSIHFYSSIQPSVCYPFIFQQLIYLSIFIHPFILTFLIHPTIDNSPIHPSFCFSSLHPSIFHFHVSLSSQPSTHRPLHPSITGPPVAAASRPPGWQLSSSRWPRRRAAPSRCSGWQGCTLPGEQNTDINNNNYSNIKGWFHTRNPWGSVMMAQDVDSNKRQLVLC